MAARPILVFGKQDNARVIYGIGSLKLAFEYLIQRSESGQLPQSFFTSEKMKHYLGSVNNERGHAFAQSVGNKLSEEGWQVRSEVEMTELGCSEDFGDVDVLAWKPSGEVQIIECKRLQLARTVAEIIEICRRFRGEAADELDKHIRRVDWIKRNLIGLERIVGFKPIAANIDDRLVTNTIVPMKYLSSLPIDCEKIGPLN